MPAVKRAIGVLASLLIAFVLLAIAVSAALHASVDTWLWGVSHGQTPADQQALNDAQALLAVAAGINRWNPDFTITRGWLAEALAKPQYTYGESARQHHLSAAQQYYRQAMQQQPLSAYAAANYASVSSRLGQLDAQELEALERALSLGRFEVRITARLLSAYLPHWRSLPAQRQALIRQAAIALHQHDAHLAERLAAQHGWGRQLCAALATSRAATTNSECNA